MTLEVELKLAINSGQQLPTEAALLACWQPLLAQPVTKHAEKQLFNAYFETAEQWFRRHDCGLRTRLKSGQYEQTIKLAGQQQGAAHIRPEYNQPCQSVVPVLADFPSEIWPQGTDVAQLQQDLQELFRTDFVRQAYILQLHDGSTVEAVLDIGTVVGGGADAPICELELELQQGSVDALFTLARAMVASLPVSLGFQSKAERGYRLAQQQPLTWLTPAVDAELKVWLRALSQNLLLQHQSSDESAPALSLLWQQFRTTLPSRQVPAALCQRAMQLDIAISGEFQLWLLDFSAWMLEE